MRARLLVQLEGATQFLVAAFVALLGFAVSNIDVVNIPISRRARWGALAVLALAAVAQAWLRLRRPALGPHHLVAAVLVALALLSALWSSEPRLTVGRALALLLFLGTMAALAVGAAGRPRVAGQLLLGLLAGATLLAVAGLVDLGLQPDRALVPATTQSPARYAGLGGNPNTMGMVFASTLPLVLWALLEVRALVGRVAVWAVALLFVGSIVASGSRGALVAATLGAVVFGLAIAASRRGRALVVAGAIGAALVGAGLMQLPQPAERNPVISPRIVPLPPIPFSEQEAQIRFPLESEIGFPRPGEESFRRSLLETSGRLPAWHGAIGQIAKRPLAGYGFGTEEKVFVDRYYLFISDKVENSFLGTALQLGLVGLGALLALLAAIVMRGRAALEQLRGAERRVAAASAGVAAAGLLLAVTQSFLTSPGSPAALPFWLSAFLLAGLSAPPPSSERLVRLDDRQRDEREHQPPDGHGKASLDVMCGEDDGVQGEERRRAGGRASSAESQREADERERDQQPVDGS